MVVVVFVASRRGDVMTFLLLGYRREEDCGGEDGVVMLRSVVIVVAVAVAVAVAVLAWVVLCNEGV